ncbi:hypothetical protein HDU92_009023 [Lobulomyces angularis]|nr:hypothetical protein HDU92_009023 [Lobulomyces angularis]
MQIVALFIYFYKQAYLDLSDAFYTGFFFSNLIMNLQDLFFGIFTISLILLTKERYIVFAFNLKAKNRKYKFITITVICITVIEYLTDTFNRFLFQTKNEAVQTLSSILFTTVVLSGITFDLYGIFRMIKVSLAYEFIRSKTVRDRMRRYKRLLFLLYFGLVMLDLLAIIVYIFPILIPLQDAFAIQSIPTVMISLHGFGALSIFRLLKKGGKYFKADSDASNFAQSAEVDLKLVSKLRSETNCPLSKARDALLKSNNRYEEALNWLESDQKISGAKKAEKLKSRVAKEGLINIVGNGNKKIIYELNSETDFACKSPIFLELLEKIGTTAFYFTEDLLNDKTALKIQEINVEKLFNCPVMSSTDSNINLSITTGLELYRLKEEFFKSVGKVGENINLRRIFCVNLPAPDLLSNSLYYVGSYVHQSHNSPVGSGRIGSLIVLEAKKCKKFVFNAESFVGFETGSQLLASKLAQHVVALNPLFLQKESTDLSNDNETEDNALLDQDYFFGGGKVRDILKVGEEDFVEYKILDFIRFECGEGIDSDTSNFAEEVLNFAKKF